MQIISLPDHWTIVLSFVLWFVIQYSAALYCLRIPDDKLSSSSGLFRSHRFEDNGRIYDKIFRISRWKHLLPDGNVISKREKYQKKHLADMSQENLSRFLIESARAELTHWLAIPPFILFGFFVPPRVVWYMLIYAILVNLPCIIAQRYNRPRVQRLLNRMASHNPKQLNHIT